MVQVQILSKILATKDYSIIEDNALDVSYFLGYEAEYEYIKDHYEKYKNVPDELTFLEKFDDFELVSVSESDKYLVDKIREEKLYNESVPILERAAELYKEDANKAVEFIASNLKNIQPNYNIGGVDIVKQASKRYDNYIDRSKNQDKYYFSTGFKELDELTHGIQRGEELLVIFARINQGKSFVSEKFAISVWEQGYNVGYFSPEMTAESIGYRFDTLHRNFSNKQLMWGKSSGDSEYKKYINELQKKDNKFIVTTLLDFNRKVTVSKLRNWIKQEKLDMIVIDGITYLTDERYKKGDNKTISITNISEDLMSLSVEMGIPIIAVVQANRNGVQDEEDKVPELEHIRDSDGLGMNASKVFSIKQKHGILEIGIKKQRQGRVGDILKYTWDIDKGEFTWIPTKTENLNDATVENAIEQQRNQYDDLENIF